MSPAKILPSMLSVKFLVFPVYHKFTLMKPQKTLISLETPKRVKRSDAAEGSVLFANILVILR